MKMAGTARGTFRDRASSAVCCCAI